MRLLDLFCGRWGWSKAFAARGWHCIGVDLKTPATVPDNCIFIPSDILKWTLADVQYYLPDFIVASPPCEEFSVHCMKFMKKKDHPFQTMGMKLFSHTTYLCEGSGMPHIVENVRCAEQFVGSAVAHANAFYLWGNAVPAILPKGLIKMGNQGGWRRGDGTFRERDKTKRIPAERSATIPEELANCVADYAERLLEQKQALTGTG